MANLLLKLADFKAEYKLNCAGLRIYVGVSHYVHLVWSQEPGQHCTYSGSFWSTLFYTVVTVAMSNLALWTLRNPETAQFFECLILQVKGSLGLPRNKKNGSPAIYILFKVVDSQTGIWFLDGRSYVESLGKVPEPKSYEQVSLFKLTLPWLRFKWGPQSMCGGGGGYVAGKTQEVRWLGQRGTYQSSAKYRAATILPATKNK